jgi:hypothetical protein
MAKQRKESTFENMNEEGVWDDDKKKQQRRYEA